VRHPAAPHPVGLELGSFLIAVSVGSAAGVIAGSVLTGLVLPATAANIALAVATTVTAACHARLVHRLDYRALLPRLVLAAPLAYGVMRAVHGALGR
jgi:hypothetical protein